MHRRTHAATAALLLALSALSGTAGCGAPAAPHGFSLGAHLNDVSVEMIDALRFTIHPQTPGMFDATGYPMTYEDGAITVEVTGGDLVLTVTGDYVRAHATGVAPSQSIAVEVWTDDDMMRAGPEVGVAALNGMDTIASGHGFLPPWPLANGAGVVVQVSCEPGMVARCLP